MNRLPYMSHGLDKTWKERGQLGKFEVGDYTTLWR